MSSPGKRQAFYQKASLSFDCTECGCCCTGDEDDYVFVSKDEALRICTFLNLSWPWFRRRYLRRSDDRGWMLTSKQNGDCDFLDSSGKCRIYKYRPIQCATYPFWPEIVSNAKAWAKEAKRCEGIGRGARLSPWAITMALKKH